jgi:uncharacterized protein (TIGR00255 family)
MTGFGKAEALINNKKIVVETRSLNSKFIDINLKLPQIYKSKDMVMRTIITEGLLRGKIEMTIHYDLTESEANQHINLNAVKNHYQTFQKIIEDNSIKNEGQIDFLQLIMRMPDVLKTEKKELSSEEWGVIEKLIRNSISELSKFRISEGVSLEKDLLKQIQSINALLEKVSSFESERISIVKTRIKKNLESLTDKENYDNNRFEQELIYYMEKYDISEEKVRLSNHLDHFLETMNEGVPNGKKLGFITQELGREINTLGSKANHIEIQKLVVLMKDHLEKIKEQILNAL